MSRRAVIITSVARGGVAARAGLRGGERIVAIDGREPWDSLDFEMAANTPELNLRVQKKGGTLREHQLSRSWGESLGMTVAHRPRACRLSCRFCFVDQQPRKMRRSLCLKDDDYALSFRDGFFVTLSNLDAEDLKRIITEGLSPLYVSVHATDPAARATLLRPRGPAGRDVLPLLNLLAAHGIELHLQIVLVPGFNDGDVLERSLAELTALGDAVSSIAIVPVGLTRHQRDDGLRRFTSDESRRLLDWLGPVAENVAVARGRPVIMASDEWYLSAERPLPPAENYGDYPQIENGVGLVRSFLDSLERKRRARKGRGALRGGHLALVTGQLAGPIIERAAVALSKFSGAKIEVLVLQSLYWGPQVTVTGLLTGLDLEAGLAPLATRPVAARPRQVLLPEVMLNEDGLFLDGLGLEELRARTRLDLCTVAPDPDSLWETTLAS